MIWYKVKKNSLDVSICRLCVVERVKGKIIYTKRKVFDKECFRIILLLSKNYCKYFFWNIQWFDLASFQEILLSVEVQSWLDFSLDFPSYTDQRSGSLISWTCVVETETKCLLNNSSFKLFHCILKNICKINRDFEKSI